MNTLSSDSIKDNQISTNLYPVVFVTVSRLVGSYHRLQWGKVKKEWTSFNVENVQKANVLYIFLKSKYTNANDG